MATMPRVDSSPCHLHEIHIVKYKLCASTHNCINSSITLSDSPGVRGNKKLPFIREILSSRRRRTSSDSKQSSSQPSRSDGNEVSTEYIPSPHDYDEGEEVGGAGSTRVSEITGSRADLRECIKSGQLLKTSRARSEGSKPGPTRLRRFRLTEEALEYLQQFSHVSPLCPSCVYGPDRKLIMSNKQRGLH